jgi:carboxylate-amine ligase
MEDVLNELDPADRKLTAYELMYCVFETQSPACRNIDELAAAVRKGRQAVADACARVRVRLVAAGAHPFSDWRRYAYVDTDHYQWVKHETGYLSDRLLAYGLHIHVGMQSDETAAYVLHECRGWVYPLLAMSANSPFFEGQDTGLASLRQHLFCAMPRTGLPPAVTSMAELEQVYLRLIEAGDVLCPGDLWWTMRPQPPLGTVELRICDLPTDQYRLCVLTAVAQAALAQMQDRCLAGEPLTRFHEAYLEENHWKAMRYGLDSKMIHPVSGQVLPMREHIHQLLTEIEPKARELGSSEYIAAAHALVDVGNEADLQRQLYAELDEDLCAVELALADRTLLTDAPAS